MDTTMFLEIIILLILIVFTLSFILAITFVFKALSDKNDLDIAKLEMNMIPHKEDFDIIDLMVTEEVNKYHIIMNEPNNVEYMSDDSIEEMERYMLNKILSNMSPINLQRLKYVYNPDKLEDIIYEKVQLAVISYSSELNTTNRES